MINIILVEYSALDDNDGQIFRTGIPVLFIFNHGRSHLKNISNYSNW